MGRLISLIAGTKNDAFGICRKTNVVAGMPTLGLGVLEAARFLLARLAWRAGTGLMTAQRCHVVSVPGAAHLRRPERLRGMLPRYRRQSRPGSGASYGIF